MLIYFVRTDSNHSVVGWSSAKFPDNVPDDFKEQYLSANNAIEVDEGQYAQLSHAKKFKLVEGQLAEDTPPVDLDQVKQDASRLVDDQAEQTRLKFVTPGAAQAGVYNLKYQEAKSFLSAYNMTTAAGANPADWPFLAADSASYAGSLYAAANIIHDTGTAWIALAAYIERLRLTAKRTIELATNTTQIEDALNIDWPSP